MTLVFPMLLGGLALATIPILIHLILRQKPKVLDFPAFRFLIQKHRTNLRKLRLRHLLLLALRMLLLALICLALTRPKLLTGVLNLRSDRPVATVLLFDTSYSMEYRITDGKNRLEDAKERAVELLDQLPPRSKVAVLDTAEPVASSKVDFVSVPEARQRIDALQLRYDSASVTARLQDAYRLFRELAEDKSDPKTQQLPRFLAVFSDAMRSSWNRGDMLKLFDAQDSVPPPLARMQALANMMSPRLALVEQLREQLPPSEGTDYPDQEWRDLWETIKPTLAATVADEFPDESTRKSLRQFRQLTRALIAGARRHKQDDLSKDQAEYQRQVLSALHKTLAETEGVYSVYVNVGVDNPSDLALTRLAFPRERGGLEERSTFTPDETFELRCRLATSGQKFNATVQGAMGSKEWKESIPVEENKTAVVPFRADLRGLPAGSHQITVNLARPDLLEFTNRRYATLLIQPFRPILIVTKETAGAQLWKNAIEANALTRFRADLRTPGEIAEKPNILTPYRAVYLFNVEQPTKELWATLKNFVERGGKLAVVPPGENISYKSYNDDSVAKQLLPGRFEKLIKADPGLEWNWDGQNVFKHPLFARFLAWSIAEVKFFKTPRRAQKYWLVQGQAKSDVLMRYLDPANAKYRPPAVIERHIGKGTVVMLTTRHDFPAATEWNNYLKKDTHFVVVWPGELTRYLAGDTERVQLNFLSGRETPTLRLPFGTTGQTFTVQGPNMTKTITRAPDSPDLQFPKAIRPGNYVVWSGVGADKSKIGAFSVNVSPEEGSLRRIPLLELEALMGRDRVMTLSHDMNLRDSLQGHWSEPVELFPWLMIGLLVLLAVENLMSNLFYRRE